MEVKGNPKLVCSSMYGDMMMTGSVYALEQSLCSPGSEDEIEDFEGSHEAAAALRAAKRARGNNALSKTAMLDAMEAAETKHVARKPQGEGPCSLPSIRLAPYQELKSYL